MSIRKALEKVQGFDKNNDNSRLYEELSVDEVTELIILAENLEKFTKNKKQIVELDSKVSNLEEVFSKLDATTFKELDNLKKVIKTSKTAEVLTAEIKEELTEAIAQVSSRMTTLVGTSGSGEVWLKNLDDVDRSSVSSASNGQALVYDSSTGKWKAGAATGGASDPPEDLSAVSQSIVPSANETYDLGSDANKWRDLYLSGSTLRLGDVEIKSTAEGDVEIKRATTSAHGTAGDRVSIKVKEIDAETGGGGGTGGGDMLTVVGNGVRFSETAKHQEKLTKGGSTPSSHMWEGPIQGGISSVDTWHFTNRTMDFDYANVNMPNIAEGASWYPATGCHVVSGQWDTSGSNMTLAPGQAFGSVFADVYLTSNGFNNWGYEGGQTHQSYNTNNVMHFHLKGRLWDNPVLSPNPQNRGDAAYINNDPTGWAWPTGPIQDINADGTSAVTMYGGKFGITGGSTLYADDEAGNDITKGWFEVMEENLAGGRYGDGSTQFYLSQRNNNNGEWYHYNNYYGLGMQIQIRFPDIENDYTIETDTVNNQGTYRVWGGTQFVEWDATVIGVRDATDPYYGGPMTDIYFVCPDETNYLKAYHAININSHRNYDLGNLSNWGGAIYQWYTYASPENSLSNVPLGSNKKATFRYYVNANAQVSAKLNWSSYFDSGTRGKTAIEFAPDASAQTGNVYSEALEPSGIEMGSQAHHDIEQNQDFTYEMNFMLGGYSGAGGAYYHGYDESGTWSMSDASRYLTTPSEIFSGDNGYSGNTATSLTLFEHGDSTQSGVELEQNGSNYPQYYSGFGLRLYHEANNGTKTFKLVMGSNTQASTIKSWDDDPFTVFQNNESSPGAGDGYYNGLFPNRWYHIAVVRNNNKIFMYLDGEDITNVAGGYSWSGAFTMSNNPVPKLMIGNTVNPTISDSWRGSIDNFRISDIARYTSAGFTPPSGDFTGDENTVLIIDKGDHGDTLFRDISYDRSFKHSISEGIPYLPIMSNGSGSAIDTINIKDVPKKGSVENQYEISDPTGWFDAYSAGVTLASGIPAHIYDLRTGPGTTANTSGGISSDTEIYQIPLLTDVTATTATGTDHYGVSDTNHVLTAIKADTRFSSFVDRLATLDAYQIDHGGPVNDSQNTTHDFYCAPPATYDQSIHYPGTTSTSSAFDDAWSGGTGSPGSGLPANTGTNGKTMLLLDYNNTGYNPTVTGQNGSNVVLSIRLGVGPDGYDPMSDSTALAGFGTTSWSGESIKFKTGTAIGGQTDAYNFDLDGSATMVTGTNNGQGEQSIRIDIDFGADQFITVNGEEANGTQVTSIMLYDALTSFFWFGGYNQGQPLGVDLMMGLYGGYKTSTSGGFEPGFQIWASSQQTTRSISPSHGPNVEDLVDMTIYRTVVPATETLPALTPVNIKVIAFADRPDTTAPPNNRQCYMYCIGATADDVTNLEKIRSDADMSGMGKNNFVVSTNGVAVIENQVLQYKNGAWSNHTLTIPSAVGDLSNMNTSYIPDDPNTFGSSVHHRRLLGWYTNGMSGEWRAHNLQDWGIEIDHLSNVNNSASSNANAQAENQFLVWHQGNNIWEPHSVDTMIGSGSTYHALRTVDFSSTLATNIPMNEPGAILTKEYYEYTALDADANTVFLLDGLYDVSSDHTNQMVPHAGFGGFKDISTHGSANGAARLIMPIYGSISAVDTNNMGVRTSPTWVIVQSDGTGARQYSNNTNTLYVQSYADDSFTSTNGPYYGSECIMIGGQDSQVGGLLEVFAKTAQKSTWTNPDTGSSTPHHGDFDIPSYYDFCIDGWFKIHAQKTISDSWYPNQLFAFGTETLASWNNNTHGYGFCAGFEGDTLRIHWNEKTWIYEDGSYWPAGSTSGWDQTITQNITGLTNSVWYHFAIMRTQNHFLVFMNGNLVYYQNRNNNSYFWYNMLPSQNHTANNNISSYPQIGLQSPNYPHYGVKNEGGWADNHTGFYLGSGSRVGNYNGTSASEEMFECLHGYLDSWRFRKALSGVTSGTATAGFGTHDSGGNIYQHGIKGGCAPDWLAEADSRGISATNTSTSGLVYALNNTWTNFTTDTNVASPSGNAKWFTPPAQKLNNFKSLSPASKPTGSIVAYNPSLNNNINVEYKPFGPPHMTTAERDAAFTTTAHIGAQVYNTDTNKMQGLISDGSGGISWVDLHS